MPESLIELSIECLVNQTHIREEIAFEYVFNEKSPIIFTIMTKILDDHNHERFRYYRFAYFIMG